MSTLLDLIPSETEKRENIPLIPKEVVVGDTIEFTEDWDDYSVSTWTLTYKLAGPSNQEFSSTDDNGEHKFLVADSTTVDWPAGNYIWQLKASDGSKTNTIATGQIELKPNIDSYERADVRSFAQKMLDAIEAALLGRATQEQQDYTIAGRSIRLLSHTELEEARTTWLQKVNREKSKSSAVSIRTRFSRF